MPDKYLEGCFQHWIPVHLLRIQVHSNAEFFCVVCHKTGDCYLRPYARISISPARFVTTMSTTVWSQLSDIRILVEVVAASRSEGKAGSILHFQRLNLHSRRSYLGILGSSSRLTLLVAASWWDAERVPRTMLNWGTSYFLVRIDLS